MSVVRIPAELMGRSEGLSSLGINEIAWSPSDAIEVLRLLDETDVAVLGGDVYRREGVEFEPTCENWYVDRGRCESIGEFAKRSREVARSFIGKLSGRECWVSLVCSESLESDGEVWLD
jgi:hypothetical protein